VVKGLAASTARTITQLRAADSAASTLSRRLSAPVAGVEALRKSPKKFSGSSLMPARRKNAAGEYSACRAASSTAASSPAASRARVASDSRPPR
jgi:hypothetical protein